MPGESTSCGPDRPAQVVIFDSSTPGYLFNHTDLAQVADLLALTSADSNPTWVDLVTRLTGSPFNTQCLMPVIGAAVTLRAPR
jgi:hypothetical protein